MLIDVHPQPEPQDTLMMLPDMAAAGVAIISSPASVAAVSMAADGVASMSGSHAGLAAVAAAACSDTSSGPVPGLEDITIVPVASLSSVSLAAAAAAAVEGQQQQQQQQQQQHGQQQHSMEALRSRRRLLFTQAPRGCSEDVIKAWCSRYGAVEQVQLYSDPAQALGAGSGLITMASNEAAAAVLDAMQGGSGGPPPAPLDKLCVQWMLQADDHAVGGGSDGASAAPALVASANRTVFFAKVPPTALASEVELLFGSFGKLAEVNLFRAWAGAKHSKGCGLVTYVNRPDAGAAIGQLHGKYVFPGSDCPMVVEWIDLKKQRPMSVVAPVEKPPMGAACDAFKLLLSNIPIAASEDALFAALGQFGRVVQLCLAPDPAGPCASGFLWYASKAAGDALLSRSKGEPVWLHDPRSGHDLALSVKKTRRPGYPGGGGGSTTTCRVSVGGFGGGAGAGAGGAGSGAAAYHSATLLSSGSNASSGSCYLPMMHLASMQAAAAAAQQQQHHSQELYSSGARLAAMGPSGGLDTLSMLAGSGVMRLLPMQASHQQAMGVGGAAAGLLGAGGGAGGLVPSPAVGAGFSAPHDVCEAMLEYCDSAGLSMGMPVHLQPTVAAQMASQLVGTSMPCLPQQPRQINSQLCCLPAGASMLGPNNSGQHCLSSPANIQTLDEFEGSFNMPTLRGCSATMLAGGHLGGGLQPQQPAQQLVALQAPNGAVWQQQAQAQAQQQMQHMQQQMAASPGRQQLQQPPPPQQQQQQQQALPGSATKSVAVPIQSYEVQVIAEHLSFFAGNSGARVTITSLPGAGLAVMLSGQPEQVAMAQSLLATARGQQ